MIKHPFDSKTLWFNLLLAVSAFWVPQVKDFFDDHPEAVPITFSVMNIIIRFFTREALHFRMPIHGLGFIHSRTQIEAAANAIQNEKLELPPK